jgi:hypothetical protein
LWVSPRFKTHIEKINHDCTNKLRRERTKKNKNNTLPAANMIQIKTQRNAAQSKAKQRNAKQRSAKQKQYHVFIPRARVLASRRHNRHVRLGERRERTRSVDTCLPPPPPLLLLLLLPPPLLLLLLGMLGMLGLERSKLPALRGATPTPTPAPTADSTAHSTAAVVFVQE